MYLLIKEKHVSITLLCPSFHVVVSRLNLSARQCLHSSVSYGYTTQISHLLILLLLFLPTTA